MPRILIALICTLLVWGPPMSPARAADDDPLWRARVQLIHDPVAGEVERHRVRVIDLFPGQNLDFTWEPARGNAAPLAPRTGAAQGAGRLIWRVRGMPDYDPRAIYAVFEGTLENGRPEGAGRVEIRNGEVYDGDWQNGLRHGAGFLRDPRGFHYEGQFADGLPHGPGVQTAPDGTVYDGPFARGLRHGEGVIRLPGGTEYAVRWDNGTEVESARPDLVADALTGGLLRAQSGEDAGRVTLELAIDQRKAGLTALRYASRPRDGTLTIYPLNRDLIDGWNLKSRIETITWASRFSEFYESGQNNAYLKVSLATGDGGTAEIDRITLEVAASRLETKPFLEVFQQFGCTGHRPEFSLVNYGWGTVEGARLRYRFVPFGTSDDPDLRSRGTLGEFEATAAPFDEVGFVDLSQSVASLGLDTGFLRAARLRCAADDSQNLDRCLADVKRQADFGPLTPFIGLEANMVAAEIEGELEMRWTGSDGTPRSATQDLTARVSLAWVDGIGLAEMGSGFEEFADTSRYIPVDLPVGATDYTLPVDYRGQRQVSRLDMPLMIRSEAASIHDFRVAVHFTDGSVRYSQPVRLFYVQPRNDVDWSLLSANDPPTCFEFEH